MSEAEHGEDWLGDAVACIERPFDSAYSCSFRRNATAGSGSYPCIRSIHSVDPLILRRTHA